MAKSHLSKNKYLCIFNQSGTAEAVRGQVLGALSKWNIIKKIRSKIALKHYDFNAARDITREIVNGQSNEQYAKIKVGLSNMSNSGCGVIAAYNALKLLGKEASLAAVALEFELNRMFFLFGFFGTKPKRIGDFFSKHSVDFESTKSMDELCQLIFPGRVFVLAFWNSGKIFDGAHFVTVKCENHRRFVVYNAFSNSKTGKPYPSLPAVIGEGRLIRGYCLKERK
ncbi:MAG: hypothetical protein IJL87_04605 [Clostridia bacterium]|nr:hypothetical protein [Clostridia bacterium]